MFWELFLQKFRSMTLKIYTPRKDQCHISMMHKKENLSLTGYDTTKRRKELAHREKEQDTEKVDSIDNGNSVSIL